MIQHKANPSDEQLRALQAFANKNGRQWKAALLSAWLSGRDEREPQSHLRRQVRNRFGPLWLNSKRNTIKAQPASAH